MTSHTRKTLADLLRDLVPRAPGPRTVVHVWPNGDWCRDAILPTFGRNRGPDFITAALLVSTLGKERFGDGMDFDGVQEFLKSTPEARVNNK